MREWRAADIEPFAVMCSDEEVMRHFPSVMTYDESSAFVERAGAQFSEYGYGLWAIEVDGAFAGFTGLAHARFETAFTPCVEVGWRLAAAAADAAALRASCVLSIIPRVGTRRGCLPRPSRGCVGAGRDGVCFPAGPPPLL